MYYTYCKCFFFHFMTLISGRFYKYELLTLLYQIRIELINERINTLKSFDKGMNKSSFKNTFKTLRTLRLAKSYGILVKRVICMRIIYCIVKIKLGGEKNATFLHLS